MIPSTLKEILVPQLLTAERYLFLGEHIGLADLQRHVLPVSVLFHVVREYERLDDVLSDCYGSMRFHQCSRAVAERSREPLGYRPTVDRVRRIEQRNGMQKRTLRVHRF